MEFCFPINGSVRITSFWGPREVQEGSDFHRGIDMVPKEEVR
jgi:hypothetical protein